MGESGHEYITAEALGPMLDKMKNEIVQEVATKMSSEITKQIVGILDTKISAAVEPIRSDMKEQTERSARHSNQLREFAQQIVMQTDQNSKVMEIFTKTGEQISHLTKSVDALIQSNQNLQKMIEFQGREIEQNRTIVDETTAREQRRSEETTRFRNGIHQSVNVISNTMVEMGNRMGGIEAGQNQLQAQVEETSEFLKRVNVIASLFDKRRNQAVIGVATVMLTQGDTVIHALNQLIGG